MSVRWKKSSRSNANNGACVELSHTGAVRDSKNPGPALPGARALVAAVKAGRIG